MKTYLADDLDTLIENEKRALIEECFHEVWTELVEEDIDAGLVAEVFAEAVLKRLTVERGSQQASKVIAHLNELDQMGFLPLVRTLQ